MSDEQQVDIETLVGRTITSAARVRVSYAEVLRLALDDGRVVDVEGFTDVFSGDGDFTIQEKEPSDG
jgi:hypothetical protein